MIFSLHNKSQLKQVKCVVYGLSRETDAICGCRTLVSRQPIGPDILTLEDETARWSRNFGEDWPLYAA